MIGPFPSSLATNLPEGWRAACKTADGRVRFEHVATGSLQWEMPTPPPAGWTMPAGWQHSKCSTTQKLCYQHVASGAVQWDRPHPRKRKLPSAVQLDADDDEVLIVAEKTAGEVVKARFDLARARGKIINISSDTQPGSKRARRA